MKVRISFEDATRQRLPRVCVRTGEPATAALKVDAYRTPLWAYAFLLIGVLPGLVAIAVVRNSHPHLRLMVPVSARVGARRRDRLALAMAATLGGVVLIVVGATSASDLAVWVGIGLSVAALVLVVMALNVPGVSAQISRRGDVVLTRVHPRFAEALESRS